MFSICLIVQPQLCSSHLLPALLTPRARLAQLDIDEFNSLIQDLHKGVVRANAAPSYDYEKLPPRVRTAFKKFDTNRSGFLDYRELRKALRTYGLDATRIGAARVLASYDKAPNGKMDISEFARLVADLDSGQIQSKRETVPDRARKAFETFDNNRDGKLDNRELRHALRYYGFDVSADQTARILEAYDRSTSRLLDIVDFSNVVQDLELGVVRVEGRPSTPSAHAAGLPQRQPRPATPDATMAALGLDEPTKTVSDPQSDPAYLREQVRIEREGREAAEAEAKAARELAADARKRVDQVRSSRAESESCLTSTTARGGTLGSRRETWWCLRTSSVWRF